MTVTEALAIFAAGVAAGTINTVVGSGTLVTFPTLLFFGYPAVVANVSNTVGLVAGGITGTWGYRRELQGLKSTVLRWVPLSFFGAVVGATLLLVLDPAAFSTIVPVLIALGVLLVAFGPQITAWTAKRRAAAAADGAQGVESGSPARRVLLGIGVWATAVYGGYFGAAQGVILMGIFSTLTTTPLQVLNAIKNVLATVVNAVAALVFIVVVPDEINWAAAGLIGVGALLGGVIGSRVGRRLPPVALRAFIVVVGVVAIVRIVTSGV